MFCVVILLILIIIIIILITIIIIIITVPVTGVYSRYRGARRLLWEDTLQVCA